MLRQALKPGDDDEGLGEGLIRENLGYMLGTILGLRELSGTVQGYFGYEGPAGARAFATAARLLKQVEQGEVDAAFWRALNDLAGILFHYPSGQTRRTIEGVAALAEGSTSNPGAVVVGAPSK
jgi:peptidoglycan hydrolase-like protein with peptidoglycan-binding domain